MADEREATGNEPASEGDQPSTTTESPAPPADSRESESDQVDWKKKYLEEGKPAQERANALARQLEQLQPLVERLSQTPADEQPQPEDDSYWNDVAAAARAGAPWAKALIYTETQRRNDVAQREYDRKIEYDRRQLEQIADFEQRKKVAEHYLRNKHRFGDPAAAQADFERQTLSTNKSDLEKEVERLKAELEKRNSGTPPTGGPPTLGRETPTTTTTVRMKRSDYQKQQDEMFASGNAKGARAQQAKVRMQQIVLED